MLGKLHLAISLRSQGDLEKSNALLLELLEQDPDNPTLNYQCAWSFDVLGLESSAIPYYEKAILGGLEPDELQGAFLGLGSTYRTLGLYEKSKEVFEQGIEIFPNDLAIKTFYAMTLYNLNLHAKAMKILLTNLVESSIDEEIKKYKCAIEFYSDKLDEICKN